MYGPLMTTTTTSIDNILRALDHYSAAGYFSRREMADRLFEVDLLTLDEYRQVSDRLGEGSLAA